tara:strand:- start:638 stop:811 length:174 start_codon:yes stop_codon:yes gene_type:complete
MDCLNEAIFAEDIELMIFRTQGNFNFLYRPRKRFYNSVTSWVFGKFERVVGCGKKFK